MDGLSDSDDERALPTPRAADGDNSDDDGQPQRAGFDDGRAELSERN